MHTASFEGVRDATRQIAGHAVRTPLIESPALNERLGGRVLLKAETMQVAGAFKFRGAWNRISRMTEAEKVRGVVLLGVDRQVIADALARHAPQVPVVMLDGSDTGVMASAVAAAAEMAQPGDTVLLAPGCASRDIWSGYDARGEAFASAARQLGQ